MRVAEIKPIDEMFAGKVLRLRTLLIGNFLTLLPLLLMLAGMGLAGGATYLAFLKDQPNGKPQQLDPPMALVLIAVGALTAAASSFWGLRNTSKLSGWYLKRCARRSIHSRPDWIVDPADPAAIFVEIMPRENWKRLMLETATDIGFLQVDSMAREVRFEGDRERIQIPGAAIDSCEVVRTIIGEGSGSDMPYYFTVLRVRHANGVRELPVAYRGDMGQLGADVRERRALTLRDRIREFVT